MIGHEWAYSHDREAAEVEHESIADRERASYVLICYFYEVDRGCLESGDFDVTEINFKHCMSKNVIKISPPLVVRPEFRRREYNRKQHIPNLT